MYSVSRLVISLPILSFYPCFLSQNELWFHALSFVLCVCVLYRGQFVIEYVGELVNYKEFRRRFQDYNDRGYVHFYVMSLTADQVWKHEHM